jgi:hypothetical protein
VASRSSRLDPDVTALLTALHHPRAEAIDALRTLILAVDRRIVEHVKWNAPSYAVHDDFATFHLRGAAGLHVVLHLGARPRPGVTLREAIADPAGLLAWRGADRATVLFTDAADVAAKRRAFTAILRQWLTHV